MPGVVHLNCLRVTIAAGSCMVVMVRMIITGKRGTGHPLQQDRQHQQQKRHRFRDFRVPESLANALHAQPIQSKRSGFKSELRDCVSCGPLRPIGHAAHTTVSAQTNRTTA
ncbi:hypothetical protein RGAI101_2143 [Roseobacter sp. GAI101]|nr:hypothetical protein RGAI101_2143 [Roseobacter sp. GAI101]